MNEEMKLAILKLLMGGKSAATSPKLGAEMTGKYVLVRTFSAGVHFGQLVSRKGKEVMLADAKRIWNWQGAKTLNEMSIAGVDVSRSKIAAAIPSVLLTEAIEVIPCAPEAVANLKGAKWVG